MLHPIGAGQVAQKYLNKDKNTVCVYARDRDRWYRPLLYSSPKLPLSLFAVKDSASLAFSIVRIR